MVRGAHWKPTVGNAGAPTPINTLNETRHQSASSSRYLLPSVPSRASESSPSPSKRRKVQESPHAHTEAHFAFQPQSDGPLEPVIPRKRSASDSICSGQSSNNKSNSQNVPELRRVDELTKARSKRPRHKMHKNSMGRGSVTLLSDSSDDDDDRDPLADEGEVDVVRYPKAAATSQQQEGGNSYQGEVPLMTLKNRFHPKTHVKHPGLDTIIDGATKKRSLLDHSVDELSVDAEEDLNPNMRVSRAQPTSPSLSTRGDVKPTQFTGTSVKHNGPQKAPGPTKNSLVTKPNGLKLEIKRAVNGQFGYPGRSCEPHESRKCFLSVREISSILHPSKQNGDPLDEYSYLKINLSKVHRIILPSTPEGCIVCVWRMAEVSSSSGPKLHIEFSSPEDVRKFSEWAKMPREGFQPAPLEEKSEVELRKELDNSFKAVERSVVLRDKHASLSSLPEDIRLMQYNAQVRRQGNEATASIPYQTQAPRKKLKDQMQLTESPTMKNNVYEVPESPPSRESRPIRTTRSTFVLKDSTPEPEPPSWTASNPGWEKRWRNSLIFPSHGKSRATVDKDDIERLNEGQFLNDNIIIFYLRYLQHKLETESPDQAQRIYFQNTFFFDKLKPTRASGGINYGSVKSWTSRVDLFMKDYIVVPINEYSHWYVAIIYNAPKLIPSETESPESPESPDTRSAPRNSIVIEDDSGAPQTKATLDVSDQAVKNSSPQRDVETGISRMSIHSPGIVETEAKRADTNHATRQATEASEENTVNLTQDPEDPSRDAEHTQTSGNFGRKKAGKRLSAGSRRYDPDQPRIITLDSLGGSHSPACNFLKQYLVAELKDKKGVEIPTPGALGMTAKNIPLQLNYCDCGLYLLGYIQEFLKDPDKFIRSILQHEGIPWDLDPPALRNKIREIIFELQTEQQAKEYAHKEEKRQAASSRKTKTSRPSSSDEPKGAGSPAKFKRDRGTRNAQKAHESRSPSHNTKLEVASISPTKTADTVALPRRENDKTNSTEEHSFPPPNNNTEKSGIATSEVAKRQSPPLLDSRDECIPSSFSSPQPAVKKRTTIDIYSQETLLPSNMNDLDEVGKKLPSPLKSPLGTSYYKSALEVERIRQASGANSGHAVGDLTRAPPRERTNGVRSESPRRFRKSHSEPRDTLASQEPSRSPYFAGRRDGDTKGQAKCIPKSIQNNVVVELSD